MTWDAASYSSLREYIHQIDFVFPEWLHVLGADGHLQAVNENNTLYNVINNGHVAPIDLKLMPLIKSTNAQVDVLPTGEQLRPHRQRMAHRHRADAGFKGCARAISARRSAPF